MLFRGLRAGDEVILATPVGRGAGADFTFALAEAEQVKSTSAVVAGYKFHLKDGRGRTVPHYILPATPANRREYLGGAGEAPPGASEIAAEADADDKQHLLALDAVRIVREADPDDVIDLLGTETLIAFRRKWRQLHPGRE
jgi:hypothetical protein